MVSGEAQEREADTFWRLRICGNPPRGTSAARQTPAGVAPAALPKSSVAPAPNLSSREDRLSTGRANIGGNQCYVVADLQRFASLPITLPAEGYDVPRPIRRTVFLDMGAQCRSLRAGLFRAVRGKRLAAVFLPMLQPATAIAGIVRGAIDIGYFHGSPPIWVCCAPKQHGRGKIHVAVLAEWVVCSSMRAGEMTFVLITPLWERRCTL
jgi:hypothetical protein